MNQKQLLNYIHQNKSLFSKFDPHEFAIGIQVEFEHTTDPAVAAKIASDHLSETDDYYTKLMRAKLIDEPLKYTRAIENLLAVRWRKPPRTSPSS